MDEFLKKLGNKVKKYREFNGFSQERLGELSNVSTNTINSIENGKTFLTYQTLSNICSALNISKSDLFKFDIDKIDNDKYSYQILAHIKTLDSKNIKHIIEIIKTFEKFSKIN